MCEAQGIVRLTTIIDHKTPLAFGGPDTDENCQGLCAIHDAIKTGMEQAKDRAVATHPEWLERPACEVVIVSGPPCSGKSTYVAEHAKTGDIVIDLDEIAGTIAPSWGRIWNGPLLDQAMRVRNAMLGSLRFAPKSGRAWFIVGAPTYAERQWWFEKVGHSHVFLSPPVSECLRRAEIRDGRTAHVQGWFAASMKPWRPPSQRRRQRVGSDADGYPVQ